MILPVILQFLVLTAIACSAQQDADIIMQLPPTIIEETSHETCPAHEVLAQARNDAAARIQSIMAPIINNYQLPYYFPMSMWWSWTMAQDSSPGYDQP